MLNRFHGSRRESAATLSRLCAIPVLAGALAMCGAWPALADESPSAAQITTILVEDFPSGLGDDDAGDAGETSLLAIDASSLAAFDPWYGDASAMPIARLELLGGVTVEVQIKSARPRWIEVQPWDDGAVAPDGFVLVGRVIWPDAGHAIIHSGPQGTSAWLHVTGIGDVAVSPVGDGLALCELIPHSDSEGAHSATWHGYVHDSCGNGDPEQWDIAMGSANSGCDEVIDLIVLYTTEAKNEAQGQAQIEAAIEAAIIDLNESMVNSLISTKDMIRLVYVAELTPPDTNPGLDDLSPPWGPYAHVHNLRDALRADLLAIVYAPGTGGTAATFPGFTPVAEALFLNRTSRQGMTRWRVLSHELGHNLGGQHECDGCTAPIPCETCPPEGVFPYAHGWTLDGPIQCERTIMVGAGSRIPYLSNPAVFYRDEPTGDADCADVARVIRGDENQLGTAWLVARHRTSHDPTGTTILASRDHWFGMTANGPAETPAISSNGQDVLFTSNATNLLCSPSSAVNNIYGYNRESGMLRLVSHAHLEPDVPADGESSEPAISGSRRFIALTSKATNLLPNGSPGEHRHVYLYDRALRPDLDAMYMMVSVANGGGAGNGDSGRASLSWNGRHIAFESDAWNLVAGDSEFGYRDIFVRDRSVPLSPKTVRVSVSTSGDAGNDASGAPAISADGRFVVFESTATNLAAGNTQGFSNVFVRDRDTDADGIFDEVDFVATTRVSRALTGESTTTPNGHSVRPSISSDGTRIAYHTYASNLSQAGVVASTDYANVYLATYDPTTGAVSNTLVSRHHMIPRAANGDSVIPKISANGRWLVFASNSTELIDGTQGAEWRIYICDLADPNDPLIVGALDANDVPDHSLGALTMPALSNDGRFIAFLFNEAMPLSISEVYLRDRGSMCTGDFNGDGVVDAADLAILAFNFDNGSCNPADLTGDGEVTEADLAMFQNLLGPCD
jgi:Tol biopolymer transport system component